MEYNFERLEVWKKIRQFKLDIYDITSSFPSVELYGLTSQIRRSTVSISANLVEGTGRATSEDKARFTNTSYASALETLDHLYTAMDLGFISEEIFLKLRTDLSKIIGMLTGLYKYQLRNCKSLKSSI